MGLHRRTYEVYGQRRGQAPPCESIKTRGRPLPLFQRTLLSFLFQPRLVDDSLQQTCRLCSAVARRSSPSSSLPSCKQPSRHIQHQVVLNLSWTPESQRRRHPETPPGVLLKHCACHIAENRFRDGTGFHGRARPTAVEDTVALSRDREICPGISKGTVSGRGRHDPPFCHAL